jgi:hypothetical protein
MNKSKQIQFYKMQLESSKQLKSVAQQNYNIAHVSKVKSKNGRDVRLSL